MIKGIIKDHLQTFPIPETSFLSWTFVVVSYSNTALVREMKHKRAIGQNNKPELHMRQTQYYMLAKHS